jgi:RNA polymerase sigma factor (TIGR02999 family)
MRVRNFTLSLSPESDTLHTARDREPQGALAGAVPMTNAADGTVTAFLSALSEGRDDARAGLWSAVYEELRAMAAGMMAREGPGHVLQPSALVHEAYMRLLGGEGVSKQSRAYFFAAAAQAMRRILIESARRVSHGARRSPQAPPDVELLHKSPPTWSAVTLRSLDEALDSLESHNREVFEVVMLRYFAELTIEQTADVVGCSAETIKRRWRYGKAWLFRKIAGSGGAASEGG